MSEPGSEPAKSRTQADHAMSLFFLGWQPGSDTYLSQDNVVVEDVYLMLGN